MIERYTWGVFRERAHSPGRESDDTEILGLTAKALEATGFQVVLKDPDELGIGASPPPAFVFLMCERLQALRRLRRWERAGSCLVNAPAAVLGTYRERMLTAWRRADVPFPRSRVVATRGRPVVPGGPVWVKRADVHNTQDGDVVFAETGAAVRDALAGLAERGIARAVLQQHVEGDLLKFYGIGRGPAGDPRPPWFRCFYHRGQRTAGHPFDAALLARLVGRAARAIGLEVFGGDVLVSAPNVLRLIDVNAWPSFALYREEAALAIASYLTRRFTAAGRRGRR